MLFDQNLYTNPNEPDKNRELLKEYSLFKRKFNNAVATEKKAHPAWTAISGIASSFIPFGLGAFITPAANMGVQKGKAVGTEKLNNYRRQLGLPEEADTSGSGLDLGGVGYAAGKGIQSGAGIGDLGMSQKIYDMPTQNQNFNYTPPAPEMTGGGTQGIDLPKSEYWAPSGGGASGLFATTQNGYTVAPATMRDGGKIIAPSHEYGGANLVDSDTGNKLNIEVEGGERIVNDTDWTKVMAALKSGKHKTAEKILKAVDKRKPKHEMAEGGAIPFTEGNGGYYNFDDPNTTVEYMPPVTGNTDSVYSDGPAVQQPVRAVRTSVLNPAATTGKFNWNDSVEYGFDGAKLGLGISEAMKPLPKYNLPPDWAEYMDKAKYFGEQGLLPEEKAMVLDQGNRDYAALVRDIANVSGGNQGAVLANLGNANLNRGRLANALALKDRELQQSNFEKYGNRLLTDIGLRKQIFDQNREQAILNKSEGAGLASDALANIQGRMDFNRFYGEGSTYDKLQKALVAQGLSDAEIKQAMAEYYKNPANWKQAMYAEPTDKK